MKRFFALTLMFCNLVSDGLAVDDTKEWGDVKILSMTFDENVGPEDINTDDVVRKTVELVREQRPEALSVRGGKLQVKAFGELTKDLGYNNTIGGNWPGDDEIGSSLVAFHETLKGKGWHLCFGVMHRLDRDPQHYSVAFLNGSLSSNARGEFCPFSSVKDFLKGEISCKSLVEDGKYLEFSPAIRVFAGRVGDGNVLHEPHKSFQEDYFRHNHVPKEGCAPYEHSSRHIRYRVAEGWQLIGRSELVKQGWYCDDIFCAGLSDDATLKTYIHPIFDSRKLETWGGMAVQHLVQQPIIAHLSML